VFGHFPHSFWLYDAAKGYYQCSHVRPTRNVFSKVRTIINCVPTCGLRIFAAVNPRNRQLSARLDFIPGPRIWLPAVYHLGIAMATTAVESLFSFGYSMKLLLWVWSSRRLSTLVHPQPYGPRLARCCTIFYASSMKVYKIQQKLGYRGWCSYDQEERGSCA
jgi:hypothetical protein